MKKIIFLLALSAISAFTTKAQLSQIHITSHPSMNCDVWVIAHSGAFQSNPIHVPAGTDLGMMTDPLPPSFWNGGTGPTPPFYFTALEVYRDPTCSAGTWTNAACSSSNQDYLYTNPPSGPFLGFADDCFEFSSNCGSCSQGDHVLVHTNFTGTTDPNAWRLIVAIQGL